MSKLKKEAVGQYNYVVPTPIPQKGGRKRHSYPDFYPHTDVTVEIIDPENFLFSNLKPPKMFDTSYFSDYQHPPAENFYPHKQQPRQGDYTAYVQAPQAKGKAQKEKRMEKNLKANSAKVAPEISKDLNRSLVRSAGDTRALHYSESNREMNFAQRVKSADTKQRITKADRVNEEFYRSLLKAQSGSEWKRKPDVSYDVLNPEKPSLKRETMPYGSQMENVQEQIAQSKGEKSRPQRSASAASVNKRTVPTPQSPVVQVPPTVKRIGPPSLPSSPSVSRLSTASGRSSRGYSQALSINDITRRPATSSSISTIGDDFLLETGRHANETLETIQEEEILEDLAPPSPVSPKPRRATSERRKHRPKLKKPQPPADLFTKKGPDPRFYASKKNLRTPNEMERFNKARARAYMKNVEQAIPEMDYKDHEVKYQPERQLFQDVRWKVRKDVKDVRDKNTNSLIDRFEKRHQVIKDETRTRLGDPTYIGRNPVSIYKLNESNQAPNVEFKVKYPLHSRRRVTPSLGSVQRARNLGSHAQIFNQPIAPPYWGPQKVDHSVYLPAMAQKI